LNAYKLLPFNNQIPLYDFLWDKRYRLNDCLEKDQFSKEKNQSNRMILNL